MMLTEEAGVEAARLRLLSLRDDLVDRAVEVVAARRAGNRGVEPELHRRSDSLVRLAPPILVHDLLERPATDRPELSDGIADRKDRVRPHAGRQTERRFALLLVEKMARGQRRAEAERPCREQHVLHRG